MNNEESRLRTFNFWPSDAVIDPSRIAKAGFFYTGLGLEVQCFACGGKISEWNYGDQVMAKHRRLDPNCPFVINPSSSGNVPKLNTSLHTAQPTSSATVDSVDSITYRSESARLESFTDWPSRNIVTPESLAKAGFYFTKTEDKVKCAFCNGVAGFWETGDDPKIEHRRHFPYCAFVLSNFNSQTLNTVPTNQITNSKLVNSDNLQELGIQVHKGPRQPYYSTLESRLRTFTNWSPELIQTPEMLAEAGFFYVGTGDQVRCFHCDGGLRHWDPDDEPWVEHARWFPSCAYVRLIKGQEFIQSCNPQELAHNNLTTIVNTATIQQPSIRPLPPSAPPITFTDSLPDLVIQSYMNSPVALAALSIGLPLCRVKQAIRQKIHDTGSSYSSADALIEAALNLQLEESDLPSETDREISHQVSRSLRSAIGAIGERKEEKIVEVREETDVASPKVSLEEENRQLKEARLCKICMDNEIGVVFLPCGHLTTCVSCASNMKDCPVCRSVIKGTVRTFLS